MAVLNLKERLQPALFDRLIDDARFISIYRVQVPRSRLRELQLAEPALLSILLGQGLQHSQPTSSTPTNDINADEVEWTFLAASAAMSPAQLKQLILKPPGAPQGIALQEFCAIESRATLNDQLESADKATLSMRKLRECVQRDLGWLLNSASLDSIEDLARYPQVTRSVLNFGMPSFAGKALHSIDPLTTARRLREVIETFEPRLSRVQVTLDAERADSDGMTLAFRIDADLWGYPATQHLVMKTSIDVETGDVRVSESN